MRATSRKTVSLGGNRRVAALPSGFEDATPERLRHADREGDIGEQAGVRRLADPFETMANRQTLDRVSKPRNELLLQAGIRFRRHWHGGRLAGLATLDISTERVDGGVGVRGTTPTEAALRHRVAHHQAETAVGQRLLPYLSGIVIEARPAADLCHLVTDSGHDRTREAIVVERLREALHRLVEHWGIAGPRATARPDQRR